MEELILICNCHSLEHQIMFYKDLEDGEIGVSVHLSTHKNIFKRIWIAIKYVFGYRCRFGEWDNFLLRENDEKKLIEFLTTNKDEI